MFKKYLNKIINSENLTTEEIAYIIDRILTNQCTNSQIGAFMAALASKGETFEEIAGAAIAMRRKAYKIQVFGSTVVDTAGTGGDSSNTFNISTTTAFVTAGCGVTVAKHGNRSVSSKCGSADALEALGVKIDTQPEIAEEAINEIGIGFLFAPLYHSAMKYAAEARKEVGIKSIFNMLGPLTNPASANCQLIGVYALHLTEIFANVLKILGSKKALVVCGHDGLDEITVCNLTRISELENDEIKTYDINPENYFEKLALPQSLKGGDAKFNAKITKDILAGKKGDKRNIILINTAAALIVAGKADSYQTGIKIAEKSIDTGAAKDKLERLIKFTCENG
ncbi:MAG: anthranilate phosphoribosyltransferase [Deltaproteobacteria bacterium]|nr:anthranilate phosphoribosyltransferase [Deltaproteobacteria bacterium]